MLSNLPFSLIPIFIFLHKAECEDKIDCRKVSKLKWLCEFDSFALVQCPKTCKRCGELINITIPCVAKQQHNLDNVNQVYYSIGIHFDFAKLYHATSL